MTRAVIELLVVDEDVVKGKLVGENPADNVLPPAVVMSLG
jgi:hypothetical protein